MLRRQLYRHMAICRANMFGRGFGGTCTNTFTIHVNTFAFACYEQQGCRYCSCLFSGSTTETCKHEQTLLLRFEIPIVSDMYTGTYFPWLVYDWSSGTGHLHPRLLHASALTCAPHSTFWLVVFCISARLCRSSAQTFGLCMPLILALQLFVLALYNGARMHEQTIITRLEIPIMCPCSCEAHNLLPCLLIALHCGSVCLYVICHVLDLRCGMYCECRPHTDTHTHVHTCGLGDGVRWVGTWGGTLIGRWGGVRWFWGWAVNTCT